ncbi:MAG: M24 family metallopeptidase, partial [Anaerolineales bacterium]|nr:M24 family metallopeptidase [Anaerolineales bacterium]
PRDRSRQLAAILGDEGVNGRSRVGCAGWKYFSEAEHPQAAHTLEIPAYIADTLRQLAGFDNVSNATSIFMNPRDGLRAICSPAEIAYFEYTNTLASDGMARMLHGLRPGMRDYEVAELIGWNGFPLSCHITFATGNLPGLSGPTGRTIQRGEPMSSNLAYWGSNSCRAGWVAETAVDLPSAAQDYVENFAGIYFEVMAEWFGLMQIGMSGDTIARLIADKLPSDKFGITLNPGHLIHLDEWLSSPIYLGSDIPLQSGMVMQVDVIPVHPVYASTRVEDGLVLADATLRQTLAASYPDLYARCQQRRAFMTDVLGIALPEEVLPLSNIPGIVPPFFLAPNHVFAMR